MKYNRIYYIFNLAFIFLIFSCKKDWLDEKTDAKLAVPTTLLDFQSLLDNSSVMNLNSPGLGEVGSDGHSVTDSRFTLLDNTDHNAYSWTKEKPYEAILDWNRSYRRIFYCNVILEGLEKFNSNLAETDQYKNIKGQALFQRARSFYELAQIWALPFTQSSAQTDIGIPLRLKSDIYTPTVRASVKECYDQIINDIVIAAEQLPALPLYKYRASKPAAFALLSRLYLSIEDYSNAQKYADLTLTSYSSLLNYNTLNPSASFPVLRLNNEIIFQNSMNVYTSIGTNALIDPDYYTLFSANDLRKTVFFNGTTNYSYKGSYNQSSTNFSGLAVDEIYLIRAECYAREGNTALAMKDLNDLLRTRWKEVSGVTTYVDQTANDAEEALTNILIERRKELLFRGLRWSDLRRLNNDTRFAITITRNVGGSTFTLPPKSYKYTFPIPDDILQQTGMQQTPGWQ